MVRHLLERDANPNLSAKGGVVPLSAAALSGEPQLAEILVRAGASVDYTGHGGLRPLLAALSVKDREFARNLVELGARPTRLAGDSMFPGDLARSQGMLDLVSEYGLAQSTITPLDVANAVAAGNLEKVKEGIEEGVDPNTRARDGWTLLHVAAINSDREMISWLLKNGADPFIEGPSGESILHTIARARADCTTCLIAINEHLRDSGDGAQEKWDKLVMSRSDSNRTALLEAIVNENYPTAGELISIGRPEQMFREPDKHGVTPLIAVALQGNHVLARRLVRKIPRSEAVNSAGEITPHEIARSRKDYALLASLPDDRDLKVRLDTNVSKSELRHVQSNLRKWGYYKGRLDGVFGPGTAAAVRALFEDRERELRSMSKISGSGWKRRTYSADSGRYLNIFPTKSSKYGKYEWEVLENRTDDRTNIIYRRRSDEWPGRLWKLTKWKSGVVGLFSNSTRGKWKSDRLYYWNE